MSTALERYLAYLGRRPVARLVTVQVGVWEVVYKEEYKSLLPSLPTKDDFKNAIGLLPPVFQFLRDIYSLAPRQMIVYVLDSGLDGLESGIALYLRGSLLNAVRYTLKSVHFRSSTQQVDALLESNLR